MDEKLLAEARTALTAWQAGDLAGRAEVDLVDAGENALVVARRRAARSGPAAGMKPATLVPFHEGKVVSMRQFRSRQEALAAAGARETR